MFVKPYYEIDKKLWDDFVHSNQMGHTYFYL